MVIFFLESLDSLSAHFDRAVLFSVDLGVWIIIAIAYAAIGFGLGAYLRHQKHFDSLHLPILGMLVALCIALPLTIYEWY